MSFQPSSSANIQINDILTFLRERVAQDIKSDNSDSENEVLDSVSDKLPDSHNADFDGDEGSIFPGNTKPDMPSFITTALNLNFLRIMQNIADADGTCLIHTLDGLADSVNTKSSVSIEVLESDPVDSKDAAIEPEVSDTKELPSSNIVITDEEGPYYIEHFVNCENNSSALVKQSRGNIIYRLEDGVTDVVVCKTFPFTAEYVGLEAFQAALAKSGFTPMAHNFRFYAAHEGTLVRLWYHAEKWRLSTHRKLDANRSRWGARTSHGEMFWDGIAELGLERETFLGRLRTDRVYTFLVHARHNRIVCANPGRQIVSFAGEFETGSFALLDSNTSYIPRAEELDHMKADFTEQLAARMDHTKYQGVIALCNMGTANFEVIKLVSPSYYALFKLRGNESSVPFAYLKMRQSGDAEGLVSFKNLYPEWQARFNEYEVVISNAQTEVYEKYVERFENGEYTVLPQELWHVAKDIHEAYLENAFEISLDRVKAEFDKLPASRLNRIIKNMQD